jgi:type IV secretion system protein VirB4
MAKNKKNINFKTTPQESKKHQVNAEDFIPYACHYDEETIITKNGELMQIIKITGFNYETIAEENKKILSLREHIREAVSESVLTNDIAVWFTTIRRKMDISPKGEFKNEFAEKLNNAWDEKNNWHNQFVTELYISILVEGEKLSIGSPRLFLESLNIPLNLKRRRKVLQDQHSKINKISESILGYLEKFGARKIGVYKEEGIYYSEMAEFISKILNLKQQRIKFVPYELSEVLAINKSIFQYNTVEVITNSGKRHLGAIMTVKEYHELPAKYIDEVLQLPVQFIITETFDFIHEEEVLKSFDEQKKIFELSKDEFAFKASGLYDILKADTEKDTDYGEHQITITVLEDTVKDLNKSISVVSKSLKALGVMLVREDIFMEDCYWSQLPGNFDFIKRKSYIPTIWAGGYASLYNFPAGKIEGNHWGDAVTVFYTDNHTPYYFSFHHEKEGHSLIIGPNGAGKTVLMNFLVAQAQKFNPKVYYFDYQRGSEVFIKALGGKYIRTTKDVEKTIAGEEGVSFNPLQLEDTPQNREFVKTWLEYLVTYTDEAHQGSGLADDDKVKIKIASDLAFRMPFEDRSLAKIIKSVWGDKSSSITAEKLSVWYENGKYAKYFDSNANDNSGVKDSKIVGFDLTEIVNHKAVTIPMVSYLLHQIELELDKKYASIIVLDEAWKLIDNEAFINRLDEWLDRLSDKNAIVIFASESIDDVSKSAATEKLVKKLKTQIFLANANAGDEYKNIFGLNESEFEVIKSIQKNKRKFLLKYNNMSVVGLLDLKEFEEFLPILSANLSELDIFDSIDQKNVSWMADYNQKILSDN